MNVAVRVALALTRFVLAFVVATWAIGVASLACGTGPSAWQPYVGCAIACCAAAVPVAGRLRVVVVVLAAALLAAAVAAALAWPDCSWDGALYHQPAMFALADGWNPWRSVAGDLAPTVHPDFVDHVRCFPKALWMVGAALYRATGDIAAANAVAWLLMLAPLGPALAMARLRGRRGVVHSLLVAALLAANPVVVYQLSTAYVDGALASVLTTLVLVLWLARSRASRGWLVLATASTALLLGIKFTGLVYACIVGATFVVAAWRRSGRVLPTAFALGIGMLGGLVLAGDSYARNVVVHGNAFHPAWRPGARDAIASQVTPGFLALGRVEQVVRALGSAPVADSEEVAIVPVPRWPLTAWKWRARYDPRFSGFGPLFLEALLLGALLWWRPRAGSLVAGIAVVAAAMATAAAWWARLAPQWWLLPLLPLLVPTPRGFARRWLERLVLAFLLANVALVAVASVRAANRTAVEWSNAVHGAGPAPTVQRFLSRPELARTIERRLAERRGR